MVGATDAHTSLPTAEEDNFFGKSTSVEPSATRVAHPFVKSALGAFEGDMLLASGYQGIWATENTREALFDAMERKETYATTGSRMAVRFFGGWEFNEDDLRSRQPAFDGYQKGVPMGASELAAVWSDPDFDADESAFYYVRVLEIPTPRWVLYDRVRLGAEIPEGVELIHQERAYTSPIWYSP